MTDRQFEMSLTIEAPRDAVWQALTDAAHLTRWFAPEAVCEPRVGGRMVWRWGAQHCWEQRIDALAPGEHLRTRYDSAVADGAGGRRPLFVDFHLSGTGGTTSLRLVHSGFGPEAASTPAVAGIRSGWPVQLSSRRLALERHPGRERQLAWGVARTSLPADAAWRQLCERMDVASLPALREGAPFAVDVPGAGPIRGTALVGPSTREFSGVAANLDDGWFRVHCEEWAGATQVWLWPRVYTGPGRRRDEFQRAFDALLAERFAGAPAAEGA